jgi:hypothetical protein
MVGGGSDRVGIGGKGLLSIRICKIISTHEEYIVP